MTEFAENISASDKAILATITTAQESEFTRANVDSIGEQVRCVDSNDDLSLYCYTNCGPDDTELLKQCRGVVFAGDTLVMKGFPYTSELLCSDTASINEAVKSIDKCVCFDAHEGVLIRVFYHDKWYISTHRRLDAFRSKWASRESFGHSFKTALESEYEKNNDFRMSIGEDSETGISERFFNVLKKDRQYMFLVRNSSENRIVCSPPDTPTMYHVGTFVDGELQNNDNITVTTPNSYTFTSINELQDHVRNSSPHLTQGLIVVSGNKVLCKILNDEYHTFFNVRGNEPSRKFRYLQVRTDRNLNNAIRSLYPESVPVFEEYEDNIYEVAQEIFSSYVKRFIRKQFITVPHEEFAVIRECHAWYESDRKNNRVNLNKVVEVLNAQSATRINHMLRRNASEKLKRESAQDELDCRNSSTTTPKSLAPLLSGLRTTKP